MIITGIGHSVNLLPGSFYVREDMRRIKHLCQILNGLKPSLIRTDASLGFGHNLLEAAISLDIPYELYVPPALPDSRPANHWSNLRECFIDSLKDQATSIVEAPTLNKDATPRDVREAIHKQNETMVCGADLLVTLWNIKNRLWSRTGDAIEHAKSLGIPWVNLWDTLYAVI